MQNPETHNSPLKLEEIVYTHAIRELVPAKDAAPLPIDAPNLEYADSRAKLIPGSTTVLTIASFFPDGAPGGFANAFELPIRTLADQFLPFYDENGNFKIDDDSIARFNKTWNILPGEIGRATFPHLLTESGLELPPGVTAENVSEHVSWQDLIALTARYLPEDVLKNVGEITEAEFSGALFGELADMLKDESKREYALELIHQVTRFLKTPAIGGPNTESWLKVLELKARQANALWQVCQPHRRNKDVAVNKSSKRLSNIKMNPFEKMLELVYADQLNKSGNPKIAFALTVLELGKDLAE